MANRRMFSLQVVDTDRFLDLPTSSQALYFHLGMHGDDDGFVSSPRKIIRAVGCCDDDLRLLATKGYIIPFESGVVAISDWNANNSLKNDRYRQTVYSLERSMLELDTRGHYSLGTKAEPMCFHTGSKAEPQHNITEPNRTEPNKVSVPDKPSRKRFTPPIVEEVSAYCLERQNGIDAQRFVDFYAQQNWKLSNGNPMSDWKAAIRNWERRDKKDRVSNTKVMTVAEMEDDVWKYV